MSNLKKIPFAAFALYLVLALGFPLCCIAEPETTSVQDSQTQEAANASSSNTESNLAESLETDVDTSSENTTQSAEAAEQEVVEPWKSTDASYTGPELTEAQAAMVCDAQGNVIYSMNPDAEFNMASITKIMTAVVALESGVSLDSQVTCVGCELVWNAQVAGYQAGQVATFEDLLKVMLVYSANDAAVEVATYIAGSEEQFVALMNKKAQELGMTHTVFKNSHGLDAEGHHSSVSDLLKLARFAMTNFSFISKTVSLDSVTVPWGDTSITFESTDHFLTNYPGALGVKTGLGNDTACFLGAARRDGVTLYSCVLGCSTSGGRFADTMTLMDAAFGSYKTNVLTTAKSVTHVYPFAYHFGFSVLESSPVTTVGLTKGSDALIETESSQNSGALLTPGSITNVVQWMQGERIVATATLQTDQKLVKSRSGFGLVEDMLSSNLADSNLAA